jgi:hypothetical protein
MYLACPGIMTYKFSRDWGTDHLEPCQFPISKVGPWISLYSDIKATNFDIEVLEMEFDIGSWYDIALRYRSFIPLIPRVYILRNVDIEV